MLPRMAEAARELTQYGRSRGVQTLIENHGFFANGSDRVIRILDLVDDDNYGLLLDTGNVICVDEDPAIAARTLAPLCRMVHLKDFTFAPVIRATARSLTVRAAGSAAAAGAICAAPFWRRATWTSKKRSLHSSTADMMGTL